jgi:hypothetical protein
MSIEQVAVLPRNNVCVEISISLECFSGAVGYHLFCPERLPHQLVEGFKKIDRTLIIVTLQTELL